MNAFLIVFAAVIVVCVLLAVATFALNVVTRVRRRPARLVAKRTHVSNGMGSLPTSTEHFVTFEAEGERREYAVSARDYGLLAEGDTGTLATKGTWFWGFERHV